MGIGILVCGLNGVGKSTFGRALAAQLKFHFIDSEELFFSSADPDSPYSAPRPRAEAIAVLERTLEDCDNFVLAAVKGDYGSRTVSEYRCVVLLEAPGEIRMRRVVDRSFQRFGERMLPGGDLYEQELNFFAAVSNRDERYVLDWVRNLNCPMIRVDGTRTIEENLAFVMESVKGLF